MRKSLCASLLLHALTLAWLWWGLPQINPRPTPIEVRILAPEKLATHETHQPSKTFTAKPRFQTTRRSFDPRFLPTLKVPENFALGSLKAKESDESWYAHNPNQDRIDSAWGEGGGTFARLQDSHLFSVLAEKIDGHLFYPGILARNHIAGTINARLILNSSGDCDFHQTRIYGTDPNLRIFVLHVMKAACQQNYKTYLAGRTLTIADLSFQFEITEHDDAEIIKGKKLIVGNSLLFYRNSQQSIAEWRLGPFRGVFPVPLINFDLQWLQENWEKYIDNRDPMEPYRPRNELASDGRIDG